MNDEIPSNPTRPESTLTGIRRRAKETEHADGFRADCPACHPLENTSQEARMMVFDRQWLLDAYERQRRQLRVLREQVKALEIGASVRAARRAKWAR